MRVANRIYLQIANYTAYSVIQAWMEHWGQEESVEININQAAY